MAYFIAQPDGGGTGADGEAFDGAWIGKEVEIHAADAGVGATYLHTLLDRPGDSSAALVGATSQVATITPDVTGTLRVRTRATTSAGAVTFTTRVIRVTKDANGDEADGGICPTSFGELPGESNYGGNARGYVERHERNWRAVVSYPEVEIDADGPLLVDHWNTLTAGDSYTIPDPADYRGRTLVVYSELATLATITAGGTIVGGSSSTEYTLPAAAEGGSSVVFRASKEGTARWFACGRV